MLISANIVYHSMASVGSKNVVYGFKDDHDLYHGMFCWYMIMAAVVTSQKITQIIYFILNVWTYPMPFFGDSQVFFSEKKSM